MLGVDSIITPVRRSLRFFQEEDYVADKENHPNQGATRDRVLHLLQTHGHAYVPNKVSYINQNVPFKLDIIRNRNDLVMPEVEEQERDQENPF